MPGPGPSENIEISNNASAGGSSGTVCPFKLITGFACPACGSTRAVLALFEGRDPLQYNPVGLVTLAAGALALVLMLRDLATGSDALLRAWSRVEALFRRPAVAVAGVALLALNWIWTLAKGL